MVAEPAAAAEAPTSPCPSMTEVAAPMQETDVAKKINFYKEVKHGS